jgi:hypothetical protein
MSVVTSLTATPSRIRAVLGTLAALGGTASRSEIDLLISPRSLRTAARQMDEDESAVTEETVGECVSLGLIRLSDADVVLTELGEAAVQDLRTALFPILTSEDRARACGQTEVPPLLCWLMMQDPYVPVPWGMTPVKEVGAAIGIDGTTDRLIPRNPQAFQQFHYWARYLGFAEWLVLGGPKSTTAVLPLPIRALRYTVRQLGDGTSLMPARDFVDRIARACPVFDGGDTRENVERSAAQRTYQLGQVVSEGLGLAIKALSASGELRLESAADADRLVIVPVPRVAAADTFTHVRVM